MVSCTDKHFFQLICKKHLKDVLRSLRTGLAAANLQKFRKLATGIHANYHLKPDKFIIICLALLMVCFRINFPQFPMAKLFSLTYSVSQQQTSVFFAYSNTLKFPEGSRTRLSFTMDLKEENSIIYTGRPTVLFRRR